MPAEGSRKSARRSAFRDGATGRAKQQNAPWRRKETSGGARSRPVRPSDLRPHFAKAVCSSHRQSSTSRHTPRRTTATPRSRMTLDRGVADSRRLFPGRDRSLRRERGSRTKPTGPTQGRNAGTAPEEQAFERDDQEDLVRRRADAYLNRRARFCTNPWRPRNPQENGETGSSRILSHLPDFPSSLSVEPVRDRRLRSVISVRERGRP